MSKRIMHLLMIFVIGFCLSLPLTVSANAAAGTVVTDPVGTPADQCSNTPQQAATSTPVVEGEAQTTDGKTEEPTDNDCTDWQTAPVSWNS